MMGECDWCSEEAVYGFGVTGCVPGIIMGRFSTPGDVIRTCPRHGWQLQGWAHQQDMRELMAQAPVEAERARAVYTDGP